MTCRLAFNSLIVGRKTNNPTSNIYLAVVIETQLGILENILLKCPFLEIDFLKMDLSNVIKSRICILKGYKISKM